ncbi:Splicing factor SPF30 [Plasmopara halstedii]|uniref:Splicing factor SPF30 n=1 Tax=Plasmopara halstedii TaxID=4781 RepID=A0A0P1A5Q3_PLAHL|nr:Splicing factor SPF30 [Plasmopara halstedii]CEG35901.1 Splicing factor SPF30 [Plasmopara halstedii]|eukprot:XP_024572270.1 Splicing factor SPF30 [Plasmopara halstedii]
MLADASLEELETRLVTFTEQLQNIHELLQSDPTNVEFLSIAKDLVEVIQLTKETIDLKVNAATSNESVSLETPHEQYQEKLQVELKFMPGSMVEAIQQDVWYPAYVNSVTSDNDYNLTFLGFGTTAKWKEDALRAIEVDVEQAAKLPPKEDIVEGMKCQAKYYVDAVIYPCSITKVTELGFQVLFDGYGNSEEVPYEYLRPAAAPLEAEVSTAAAENSITNTVDGAPANGDTATAPKVAPAVIHKPIKIPENLQILPTDTEAEKERKRKRLRAIKSLNRHKNIDNERNIKQHDWKAFQYKAKKKGLRKGVSGVLSKRGSSMFASPDTVQGRVGVVGSGQGMTDFQDTRIKKFKQA